MGAEQRRPLDERALVTLGAILGFIVAAHVLVADPVLRYAAYLLGFSLWMAWFVLAAVRWYSLADYR